MEQITEAGSAIEARGRDASALRKQHSAPEAVRVIEALRERWQPSVAEIRKRRGETSSLRAIRLSEAAGLLRRSGEGREVGGSTHSRYQLYKQGWPVFNRRGVLREADGQLKGYSGSLTLPSLLLGEKRLASREALELAMQRAGVSALRGVPRVEAGWFALASQTVPAWRVILPSARPLATYQVILDGQSGVTLSLVDLVRTATGQGSVYDPNVVMSPTPVELPLFDLNDSGYLIGRIAGIYDALSPSAFRPDLQFSFPVDDPRFVQTSVYRGLTDTARFAEDHGFPLVSSSIVAYTSLPDPDTGGEFNNAFYDPHIPLFAFGDGDGILTANLGTDLDVAAHEMGHHVFETLVEPTFFTQVDPILAMSEGVSDTFSALVGGDPNVGESTIPGEPFLRTLANSRVFPDDMALDPHETGLIYGGANWEMIQLLGTGPFTDLLLASLAQLPPEAQEVDYRDAFLQANLDLNGGVHQAAIEAIFSARGFDSLEFPPEFEGFLEDGIPESRYLPDSPPTDPEFWNLDVFVFFEFPGSTDLTVETTGSGDVDLVLIGINDTDALATAENIGSNETITLTPSTDPSVHADDDWFIAVFDYPDGQGSSYTITARSTLPPGQIAIDGPAFDGALDEGGEFDLLTFTTSIPGQVVRLEAEALDPTLDPLVGIVDPHTYETYGADDDSGPGTDSLIQGALLPNPGTYVIVVVSVTRDIDPTIGAGRYRLRLTSCDNSAGPNLDGDELVDACDDDDDDDGFRDAVDLDPLDAGICADLDRDGCNDCSGGAFDPFDDGADNDGDGICDAGDVDDDNDGCRDEDDPASLTGSVDDDLDFLGADCDVCPAVSDPDQADADEDGIGDACECGDASGEGFLNTIDARLIQRCAVGELPCPELCDVTGEGDCNTIDARLIQRYVVGELGKEQLHCAERP